MKGQQLFGVVIWAFLALFLLVGCGSDSEEQLTITFDGDDCTVTGPTELTVGEQLFIVRNSTEEDLSLLVSLLLDGHTHQDLVDRVNELGSKIDFDGPNWPDFLGVSGTFAGFEKGESAGEELITLRIMREGDYASSLYDAFTGNFYPCGPLEVVEAPSE